MYREGFLRILNEKMGIGEVSYFPCRKIKDVVLNEKIVYKGLDYLKIQELNEKRNFWSVAVSIAIEKNNERFFQRNILFA